MEDLIEELAELAFDIAWPKIQKFFRFIRKTLIPALGLTAIAAVEKAKQKRQNKALGSESGAEKAITDGEFFDDKK